ncbi:MAG: hypothetical protein ACJAR9_000733 [Celeribacter sp.]|jgi:hypothetical protein
MLLCNLKWLRLVFGSLFRLRLWFCSLNGLRDGLGARSDFGQKKSGPEGDR